MVHDFGLGSESWFERVLPCEHAEGGAICEVGTTLTFQVIEREHVITLQVTLHPDPIRHHTPIHHSPKTESVKNTRP